MTRACRRFARYRPLLGTLDPRETLCQTSLVTTSWGESPRSSITRYAHEVGEDVLVGRLVELLGGDPLDDELGVALAGPASRLVLAGREGGPTGYWARVWALRGLHYVWRDVATDPVIASCADPSWRCREMALKVAARHRLDEALEVAARRQRDEVVRVRLAAQRVLRVLTADGSAP